MGCEEVRNRFADYLNGELPESTRAEWREHMASCEACREETESLEALWARLGEIPAERPDAGVMRARFDDMLAGYTQGLQDSRSVGAWKRVNATLTGWWPREPLLQAGLAAAMLVVGVWVGGRVGTPASQQPAPDLTELRRELHDMRQMLTLSLMQQQSATERLRGVSGSVQIDQPGTEIVRALLETLMHDPNVNVRLACVDALRRFSEQDVVRRGTVQALAESSYPLVQIALIDFMVETKDKEAIDALRQLSEDSTVDVAVRGRAAWGVGQLNL